MLRIELGKWWSDYRKCCCGHNRFAHTHYTKASDLRCSLCICEKFQWRLLKWVY